MNQDEAQAALAAMQLTKDRLAENQHCPPWRHAAFGIFMAAINVTFAVPAQYRALLIIAWVVAGFALVISDRRRSGTFVNGYRRGRTLSVTLALLGMVMALLFAQIHAVRSGLSWQTSAGIAVLTFLLATLASVIWQRVYVAELREGGR